MMHRSILYKRGLQEDLAAALLGSDRWLVDVVAATLTDRDSEDGAILVVMEYLVVGLEVDAFHGSAVQLHARKSSGQHRG